MQTMFKSELLSFLTTESPEELKRLVGLSIFSGLINTSIIAIINAASKDVSEGKSVTLMFLVLSLYCSSFN